mgnify:FL=1
MAGKATSIYVSVAVKGNPFDIVFKRQFFSAKAVSVWMKEAQEKYPSDQYRITKEVY